MAEVDAPAAKHRVEPVQQLAERLIVSLPRDLPDPSHDRRKRRPGGVGVDVAVAVSPRLALDAEAEELDPLVDMGDAGLLP